MPATYQIKGVDEAVYRRAKSRAAAEGTTFKAVLLRLIQMYADGLKLKQPSASRTKGVAA